MNLRLNAMQIQKSNMNNDRYSPQIVVIKSGYFFEIDKLQNVSSLVLFALGNRSGINPQVE